MRKVLFYPSLLSILFSQSSISSETPSLFLVDDKLTTISDIVLLNDQLDQVLTKEYLNESEKGAGVAQKNIAANEDGTIFFTETITEINNKLNDEEVNIIDLKNGIRNKSEAYILLKQNGFEITNEFSKSSFSNKGFKGVINGKIELKR
ncbi:hypothetical protein TUMSATVNIG1_28660 [Vibrio nigripulchritudo]|uniref:hypothetical protein n=1 Tax=Vibrio nigripulchritudo TaxID=28173 RepID=UPI00190D75E8|nr:hypothetical protein [Vibrio nigripulchritudo]BCL70901.1 hypothetical protein VNTUMSATTG_28380 [Vibrio nigripulchritudo]BDU32257.1 hypothetical protein TUMSATVNIG1_28660 [Vibrio nigripulchritudo]